MSEKIDIDLDEILNADVPAFKKKEELDNKTPAPSEDKEPPVSNKEVVTPDAETEHLRNRLRTWNENCRDIFVDLRSVNYTASPEDSYLEFQDSAVYSKRLYFKVDPQNAKDPKVTHAQQQLCKFLGVPHAFFVANRPTLKMNIVRTWQAGLSATESKAQCIVKIRESQDCSIIRAFVSTTKCTIPLYELIDTVMQSMTLPVKLEFVYGDDKDDLIMHARFLFEKEYYVFDDKIPVCLGFSLLASELDASPLTIEIFVHDKTHKTSYIACYGGDPFFKSKYEGLKTSQLRDIFPKLLTKIDNEAEMMFMEIRDKQKRAADAGFFCVEDEADKLMRSKGISGKIKKAVYHQITECIDDIKTPWDLARHVSLVAKDCDSLRRLDVERAAGKYLQLYFGKE